MSVRTEQILSYNPAFDYVRAIASLTVLIAHAGTFVFFRDHYFYVDGHNIFIFETVAALAVEFFFALSGILLGRILYAQFSHKHRRENIRIFLIRRWMRTLPLYYLGLLAYFILYDVNQYEIPDNWPAYFVFLQSPLYFNTQFYGVSWSLCIEEIFYVLFPLIAGVFVWKGFSVTKAFVFGVALLIVICFFLRWLYFPHSTNWLFDIRSGYIFRLDSIAVGVFVGILVKQITRTNFAISCGFVGGIAMMWMLFGNTFMLQNSLHMLVVQASFTGLPWACALIILYFSENIVLPKGRLLTFFADISYALYVCHMPVLYMLFMAGFDGLLLKILFLPVCIATAYLLFRYVETPFLRERPQYIPEQD